MTGIWWTGWRRMSGHCEMAAYASTFDPNVPAKGASSDESGNPIYILSANPKDGKEAKLSAGKAEVLYDTQTLKDVSQIASAIRVRSQLQN